MRGIFGTDCFIACSEAVEWDLLCIDYMEQHCARNLSVYHSNTCTHLLHAVGLK